MFKGRLGGKGHQYRYPGSACLYISGSSQASHILVVQNLPRTVNFLVRAPTDSLQKREEYHSNSDLHGIKIIKIGPWSRPFSKKEEVQSEHEWTTIA